MSHARPVAPAGPARPAPQAGSARRPVVLLPEGHAIEWPASGGTWTGPSWPARFEAAARLATMVHPGPVGELVARELRAGLVCAGRFGAEPFVDEDALLVRVVEDVLGSVERRVAVAQTTGSVCPGSRVFRPSGPRWPSDLLEPPPE